MARGADTFPVHDDVHAGRSGLRFDGTKSRETELRASGINVFTNLRDSADRGEKFYEGRRLAARAARGADYLRTLALAVCWRSSGCGQKHFGGWPTDHGSGCPAS